MCFVVISNPETDFCLCIIRVLGFEYDVKQHEGQERVREPRDYASNFRFRNPNAKHNEDFDL